MKTTSKLFSNWAQVTSRERNEIVFERLNKTYGAYEIRTNYDNTLTKAFAATLLFIGLLTSTYFIVRVIPIAELKIPKEEVITIQHPLIENPFIPKQPELPTTPASSSTANLKPDVTDDRNIDDKPLPKNPDNNNLGTGNPLDTGKGEPFIPIAGGGGEEEIEDTTTYWSIAIQELPRFPGGDEQRKRFLQNNLRIPESIKEIGNIKEKIGVVFTVNKDGSIADFAFVQGGSKYYELNNEAMRVIKKMPDWEPGRQNGTPVKVRMIMPLTFEVK